MSTHAHPHVHPNPPVSAAAERELAPRIDVTRAVLWACAAVLTALVIVQLPRVLTPPAAHASLSLEQFASGANASGGMVTQAGSYVALTADAGSDDLLVVADNRSEELLVYRVEGNASSVALVQRLNLSQLFSAARARSLGKISP